MSNKKRYKKIVVNGEAVVDFSEQAIDSINVFTGNTFFDRNGNLVAGTFDMGAFLDKTITEFHIPEGTTTLGAYAFSGYENLSKIYIPNSLTYIESGAFEGCYSLSEVHVDSIDTWLNISFDEYGYNCNPISDCGATLYVQGQPVKKANLGCCLRYSVRCTDEFTNRLLLLIVRKADRNVCFLLYSEGINNCC
jgi:hypothetical protein